MGKGTNQVGFAQRHGGKPKIQALAPMLDALGIEQVVTLDECCAMLAELRSATGATVPPSELSGNQWCALMNLAIARHKTPNVGAKAPT